jgi:hypothetical protein
MPAKKTKSGRKPVSKKKKERDATPPAVRAVGKLVRAAESARKEGALSASELAKIAPEKRRELAERALALAHLLVGWARAIEPK